MLTKAQVKQLADLPSRDQMLGTLLATFLAPVSAFARVLYAIQEKKEKGELA
jgi:large subunit ribosomal protein L10